ncbi:hypothetical protein BGZ76_002014 [Entomortierella beljakovae]|nr:hypothetical protein BGZ76_002014 [Entomortierella beljakovae]
MNSIAQGAANLSLDPKSSEPPNSSGTTRFQDSGYIDGHSHNYNSNNDQPTRRNPHESHDAFGGQEYYPQRLNNPQLEYSRPHQEYNNPQTTTVEGSTNQKQDAWADQGHFPLLLGQVSCKSISVRGGSRIHLTGVHFRDGVEVVFECPKLKKYTGTRVVTPKVLKSTEMEFITPNFMDWWAVANNDHPCKELDLSVSLTCAGERDEEDNTAFEMSAQEDSEAELLRLITLLYRQQLQVSVKAGIDSEADRNARQRTQVLLNLERPDSVSESEHIALSVIYMLCDGEDRISEDGLKIFKSLTADGHDILHLAVIQGLPTLAREIARHLLSWFQVNHVTWESEVFVKNLNGESALDFAKSLGHSEIEKALQETLTAANEYKKSVLKALPQPPLNHGGYPVVTTENTDVPPRFTTSPTPNNPYGRPLPPTPFQDSGSEPHRTTSYFSTTSSNNSHIVPQAQYSMSSESLPQTSASMYPPASNDASNVQAHPYSPSLHSSSSPMINSMPIPHPTGNQQGDQSPDRPLPDTPQSNAPPLLPPRHKVTRVNRPKQFTIPSPENSQTQAQSPSMPNPQIPTTYQAPSHPPPPPISQQHTPNNPMIVQPAPLPAPPPGPYHQPMPTHQYPVHSPMPMHQQLPTSMPMHHSAQVPLHHPPPNMPLYQYPGSMMQQYPIPQAYETYGASMLHHYPEPMVRGGLDDKPDSKLKVNVD